MASNKKLPDFGYKTSLKIVFSNGSKFVLLCRWQGKKKEVISTYGLDKDIPIPKEAPKQNQNILGLPPTIGFIMSREGWS